MISIEYPKKNRGKTSPPLLYVVLATVALAAVLAAAAYLVFGLEKDPPHIVLISIDTLRHDHMGYLGYTPEEKTPSPFVDNLAQEGTVFTQAVSTTSWTLPGHYALITGLPDELHEVVDDAVPFNPKIQTMAEFLKSEGYATGGFYSAPYLHPFFGFERGFDWYHSCMKEETMYDVMAYKGGSLNEEQRKNLTIEKEMKSHLEITSEAVTSKAVTFAKVHKGERMFLFLHYFDVHNDYRPPPPFNQKYGKDYKGWVNGMGVVRDPRINPDMPEKDLNHLKALYNGEISWVDHNIERFFEGLKKHVPGFLDQCIVVITSDHGEEFFEHDRIGHRWNLYGETLKIPLMFWGPGIVPEGKRFDLPVAIYDIYPTVLDLAGISVPTSVYGRSLAPLFGDINLPSLPVMSELTFIPSGQQEVYHKYFSLQQDHIKMIGFHKRKWSPKRRADFTGEKIEEHYEIYDLESDPYEKKNLFDQKPELSKEMLTRYEKAREHMKKEYIKLHGDSPSARKYQQGREVPKELQMKLKQLGYD